MTYAATDVIDRPIRASSRVAMIVAAYVAVFFVLLPGLLWTLGGRLDVLLALPPTASLLVRGAGAGAVVSGAGWMAWTMWVLWRTGVGMPISHLPPARLTTIGPYAVMRHPIYVGYVVAFAGAGAIAGSLGRSVIATALLAWGSAIYALGFEEARLERRFGAAYATYRMTTPAFRLPSNSWLQALCIGVWRRCRPLAERAANCVILVRIGPTTWVTYGLLAAAAAAVTGVWMGAVLNGAGLPRTWTALYLLGVAVSVPLGSRAMWLAYRVDLLWSEPPSTLRQVGFVSWGGVVGMLGFAVGFAWVAHLDVLWLLDATAVAGLAGLAVARIGCFTYGCCYGRPSALGICWTDAESKPVREHGAAGAVARVPTQLLSSAAAAALFAVLVPLLQRGVFPGTVTGLALLGYSLVRFGIECLRADSRHGPWRLTQGQVGCLVAASLGVFALLAVPVGDMSRSVLWLDFADVLPLWPILAVCVTLVFGVYGFHWRQVGRW
jgi:prolipoprotein diacylglyceryltransferase/protein-S-isoprenylcysteine O-methyltransferase Ste14